MEEPLPSHDDVPPVSAEELVEGEHVQEVDPLAEEPRRYPSTIGGAFYLLVLAGTVAGLVLVVTRDWRLGIQVCGSAMILAALVRLVLRERDAGMLAVRNRFIDAFWLIAMGAAMITLAVTIPNQPGA